jgi:plasmid stabilization system protein ParE
MKATSRMQFTFQACKDLNGIWESIAMPSDLWGSTNAEHLAAARSFAEKLEQLCQLMTLHPEIGQRRSTL